MIEWNSNNYLIKVKESFSIFIHFIASFFLPFVARADEIPRAGPFIENWVCNTHKILFFESFFHNPRSFQRRFLSFFFRANGGDRLVMISEAEKLEAHKKANRAEGLRYKKQGEEAFLLNECFHVKRSVFAKSLEEGSKERVNDVGVKGVWGKQISLGYFYNCNVVYVFYVCFVKEGKSKSQKLGWNECQ